MLKIIVLISCLFSSLTCVAHELIPANVLLTPPNGRFLASTTTIPTKTVYLLKVGLTPAQADLIAHPPATASVSSQTMGKTVLPVRVLLGMNGTPALDQGRHGTCVTFAATAAIDALLKQGDYISQLCSLELGLDIANNSFIPYSGWDGSTGDTVLTQLLNYGVISKQAQAQKSCNGIKEYPLSDQINTSIPMSPVQYKTLSHDITNTISHETLLSFDQRFAKHPFYKYNGNMVLQQVKSYLALAKNKQNYRLIIGAMLTYGFCNVGACASYHASYDTWALTDKIKNAPSPAIGGHEMIITGYDDTAVATDEDGKKHYGLLFLRNSWGALTGDHGDFYMSYDYFKQYILDIDIISLVDTI